MFAGKFSKALNVLWSHDDFKVQTTFLAVALVDLGLMPTRYQTLNYVTNLRGTSTDDQVSKKEFLAEKLGPENSFDYHRCLYFLAY